MKEEIGREKDRGWVDRALTVILLLSIIASIAALVYVVVTPKEGEKFTEFYILGPGGRPMTIRLRSGQKRTAQ